MRFRLHVLLCAFAALCLGLVAGAQSVPAGYLPVFSSRFLDSNGVAISNATICAQVQIGGHNATVQVGGSGTASFGNRCAPIVAGAWRMNLPDMSTTAPKYACIKLTATDDVSGASLLSGYNCAQPRSIRPPNVAVFWCGSAGCNLDDLPPNYPASEVQVGADGAAGPPGCVWTADAPCSPTLAGVPVDAYASFALAVSACGTENLCDLVTSSPVAVTGQVLPANIIPRFVGRGQWVSGSVGTTVTVSGGKVIAPAGGFIFNNVAITGLLEARPDWFAAPVGGVYPKVAMRSAYNATGTNSLIQLSRSGYQSDFDIVAADVADARDWVGAGRPMPDTQSGATSRLVPGTGSIIYGPFVHRGAARLEHIGVDCGSWWMANLNGGAYPALQNGLEVINVDASGTVLHGNNLQPYVNDVAVVSTPRGSNHLFLIESYVSAHVENFYGYVPGSGGSAASNGWGFIVKSEQSTFSNINVWGASDAALYDKSDYGTNTNGHSSYNHYFGVHLHSNNGPAGSVMIHASGDTNVGSSIVGLTIDGAGAGIKEMTGGGTLTPSGWTFQNVQMTNMLGPCFYFLQDQDFTVRDWTCTRQNNDVNAGALISSGSVRPRFYNGVMNVPNTGNMFNVGGNGDYTKGGTIDGFLGLNGANGFVAGPTLTNGSVTGTASGWSISNWKTTGSLNSSIYCENCDNLTVTNADGLRTTNDINGVFEVGLGRSSWTNITARGTSSNHPTGLVSNVGATLTLVDRMYCVQCGYTVEGKNTGSKTLRVHGLFWDATPASGDAPFYNFSANGTDSSVVADF